MEWKLTKLFITVKIICTFSKDLLISFFGGWYRWRCQRCLTAFVPTFIKLQQVVQSKARRFTLHQRSQKCCVQFPPTPGANLHCLIPVYSARHSQTLFLSSSCLVPVQAEQQLLLPWADLSVYPELSTSSTQECNCYSRGGDYQLPVHCKIQ